MRRYKRCPFCKKYLIKNTILELQGSNGILDEWVNTMECKTHEKFWNVIPEKSGHGFHQKYGSDGQLFMTVIKYFLRGRKLIMVEINHRSGLTRIYDVERFPKHLMVEVPEAMSPDFPKLNKFYSKIKIYLIFS